MPVGYVRAEGYNPFMFVWGGIVFGSLSTLALLAMARWVATTPVLRFLALLAAAFCLGHNALYLFVGSLTPFSDAADMIRLGAPRWLLFLLSLPLVIGFVAVLSRALRAIGLRPTDSAGKWIVVTSLGLLPIPGLMLIPLFASDVSREMRLSMLVLDASYAACFAIAAYRARASAQSRGAEFDRTLMPERWGVTFTLFLGAALFLASEWLAFRPN